ncbi:uncharacterized protein LOC136043420 isoform X2 [Artemia franciscana]|uniref:uncharacterized protein LOC136043420 isoform X2 n=1 Tax=Artemia franciscana TaxID=6661 RepID=UPI0032DA8624
MANKIQGAITPHRIMKEAHRQKTRAKSSYGTCDEVGRAESSYGTRSEEPRAHLNEVGRAESSYGTRSEEPRAKSSFGTCEKVQ